MNIVERQQVLTDRVPALAPPLRLEPGTIATLRMRGHTRTQGLEYYAPAVVLQQHQPNGEIEVLIWDSTAGTHYNPSYSIRDLGVRGEGATREMYELQSNIGQVLFSPSAFSQVIEDVDVLLREFVQMRRQITALEAFNRQFDDANTAKVKSPAAPLDATRDKSAAAPSGAQPKKS